MKEQDIQNAILDWLRMHGAWAERINSGTQVITGQNGKQRIFRGARKGTADILACWPGGLFCAIEVKKPGNTTSPEQDLFLQQINDCGGLAVVAYSTEDVENALRERIEQCQQNGKK